MASWICRGGCCDDSLDAGYLLVLQEETLVLMIGMEQIAHLRNVLEIN